MSSVTAEAAPAESSGAHNKRTTAAWHSHSKLPQPTWIPARKAAAASLGSWRDSTPPEPNATAKPPTLEESPTAPKEIHLVRAAVCPKDSVAVAVALTAEETGVSDKKLVMFELPPHRALLPKPANTTSSSSPNKDNKEGGNDEAILTPNESGMAGGGGDSFCSGDAGKPPCLTSPPTASSQAGSGSSNSVPEMALPEAQHQPQQALVCVLCPTLRVAEVVKRNLQDMRAEAVVDIECRPLPPSCTIVVKGIPLSIRHESLWEELSELTFKPSYMRFHRNDRGLFKNVVYIKFPSAVKAELGRLEMDRCSVGGRVLKVEVKKPRPQDHHSGGHGGGDTSSVPSTPTPSSNHHTPQHTPKQQSTHNNNSSNNNNDSTAFDKVRREDNDEQRVAVLRVMERAVQELIANSEQFEGLTFAKTALTREEQRYLKGLCTAHDLIFDLHYASGGVSVKRRLEKAKSVSPSLGALRTPPWHATTPPLSFRDTPQMGPGGLSGLAALPGPGGALPPAATSSSSSGGAASPDSAEGGGGGSSANNGTGTGGGGGASSSGIMFRGIRHWKEARQNLNNQQGGGSGGSGAGEKDGSAPTASQPIRGLLPIYRPINPGEVKAWGSGRGRPGHTTTPALKAQTPPKSVSPPPEGALPPAMEAKAE